MSVLGATAAAMAAMKAMPDEAPGAVVSCPAHVGLNTPIAPSKNPCAGIGMANAEKEKGYVDEFKKVQDDWKKLSQKERETKLREIIQKPLHDSGVSEVGVRSKPLATNRNGEFDFTTWTLTLNQSMTKAEQLTDEQARKLAGTVYHEARHCEQWYLIAQKRAAEGKDADTISRELGIPKSAAEGAVKNPLKKNDPRCACADALYDSVYGKNKDHREKTLKELAKKPGELQQAADTYHKLDKDPKATAVQKKAALDHWKKAYAEWQQTYEAYRSLPEESDAWTAGDNVESAWKAPPPKPPVVKKAMMP